MSTNRGDVQRSFDELGTPLCDVTFCVLDLETTGGDRNGDAITEVGAVKVRGGECLGTFQTLVDPGRPIPPKVSILTGLTDALVAQAPRIDAVLPSLLSFLGDAVFVGHNVRFDLGFLQNALERTGRERWSGTVLDTVQLSRRLVRDEVPNCRLGTLASRFRLEHQPSHRALDDALATTDLLHLLIERAAGYGVLGLDDLVALGKIGGHPSAAKLSLTSDLPRRPGVYLFHGANDSVLYAGKATNLRQRVRSYFGSDDRRKIGPMLRETTRVSHIELPDPLTAEVVETRIIGRTRPRYNRRGTTIDKYRYVRLDTEAPWPRLSVVRDPAQRGVHLGPLTSQRAATIVVEALQTALPLQRCSRRLGKNHRPEPDAPRCSAAQLGVAHCPCSGGVDPAEYAVTVGEAVRAMDGDPRRVAARLRERMFRLAADQRFEEAAMTRDRLSTFLAAVRRTELLRALGALGSAQIDDGEVTWIVQRGALVDVRASGQLTAAIPVAALGEIEPLLPVSRAHADEALVLASFLDRHAHRLRIECTGAMTFPLGVPTHIEPLRATA